LIQSWSCLALGLCCALLLAGGATIAQPPARAGDIHWWQELALGASLPPVSPREGLPRLIAGNSQARLYWAGGSEDAAEQWLRSRGWTLTESRELPYAGVLGQAAVAMVHQLTREDERRVAGVVTFGPRVFAVLGEDESVVQSTLGGLAWREGVPEGAIAPLLPDGRHVGVLKDWRGAGTRFTLPAHDLHLRLFHLEGAAATGLEELPALLEVRLEQRGYRRIGGAPPVVAGRSAILRVYSRDLERLQHVLYARHDGGYLVAVLEGPWQERERMTAEAEAFAASIEPLEVAVPQPSPGFAQARNLRVVAWLTGDFVQWGVLFDDAAGRAVFWRQPDVTWRATLTRHGDAIAERTGTVGASAELNPLRDAPARALPLTEGAAGEFELAVEVGGARAAARILVPNKPRD
jgi:hypothetical protein